MKSDNETRVKDLAYPLGYPYNRADPDRGYTKGRNKYRNQDVENQDNRDNSGDHFNGSERNRENNNNSVKTYLIIGVGIAVGAIIIVGFAIGFSK